MENKVIQLKKVDTVFDTIKKKLLKLSKNELKYIITHFEQLEDFILGMYSSTL